MTVELSSAVGRAFYDSRTLREAQRDAVAPLLDGHDTLVIAGTGSGKTEAVLAPLVDRYLEAMRSAAGPVVLYLTPTRALANDLMSRLELPLEQLHVRSGVQHGERKDLDRKQRPTFLVTTPESFDNLLVAPGKPLQHLLAVVIDEVHQLAGTQRGLQVRHLLNRLEHALGRPVQVAAMSATVARPLAVWQRVRDSEPTVVEVRDARTRRYVLRRETSEASLVALFERLAAPRKVLVFCNSRRESEQVGGLLRSHGVFGGRVFVHHSSLDRVERLHVESELRSPERAVCVATSTLELGIDIGDVDLVVLCAPPADWRSFSQRLGRGNRRSDAVDVLCLITPWSSQPLWEAAVFHALALQMEGEAPKESDEGPLFGSTAQQVVSHLRGAAEWLGSRGFTEALGAFVEPHVEEVLDELVEHDVLQRHPVRPRWGFSHGYEVVEQRQEVWGNFPASSSKLTLVQGGNVLGEVPYGNVLRLEPGTTFPFQGRVWRVLGSARRQVMVASAEGRPDVQLIYGSSGARLDPTLVDLVPQLVQDAPDVFTANQATRDWWSSALEHIRPALGEVPAWKDGATWYHATFAGRLVNEAMLRLLGAEGEVTESLVATSARLDVSALPPFGEQWLQPVADFLENPDELTPWQQRLPPRLLREELLGPFLTHPVYPRIVERLRTSVVVTVPDDRLLALSPEFR